MFSKQKGGGVALVVAAVVVLAAAFLHGSHGQAFQPTSIVNAAEAAVFLSSFLRGVEMTGFQDLLSSPEWEGTVFAPTDLAFEGFLEARGITFEQLAENKEAFRDFIAYHVVPGPKLFPMAAFRQGMELTTQAGEEKLFVDRSTPSIVHIWSIPKMERTVGSMDFATILQFQGVQGGKSILYTIDKPLLPQKMREALPPAPATEATAGP